MKFEDKLKSLESEAVWQEYCGFLDLDIDGYMQIQNRLMLEQLAMWSKSGLGRQILDGKEPKTIEEFREQVPLTTYSDYADILLSKQLLSVPAHINPLSSNRSFGFISLFSFLHLNFARSIL
jgi:hypothetical protein